MNTNDYGKIFGMIGLAAKAGKIRSGEFCTEKSVKTGKAKLCIVASDASMASKKKVTDICRTHNVRLYEIEVDKETLGHVIGRGSRTSVTIEDERFADSVLKLIEGGKASERK